MDYGTRPQRISLQCNYFRSLPGVLKVIQFVCDLVALILGLAASSQEYVGQKGYYTFVAALAIIITTLFLIFALINLQAICCQTHWLVIEMWWCLIISIFFLVAGIVAATVAKERAIYGAAAFFAFAALLAYAIDGINRFRLTRAGPPGLRAARAAGTTTTTTTETIVQRHEPTY